MKWWRGATELDDGQDAQPVHDAFDQGDLPGQSAQERAFTYHQAGVQRRQEPGDDIRANAPLLQPVHTWGRRADGDADESGGLNDPRWFRWLKSAFLRMVGMRRLAAGAAGLGITATLVLFVIVAYHAVRLPNPSLADLRRQTNSVEVYAADGTLLARRGERLRYVRLADVPEHLISAVLSTEDRRFVDHHGVDFTGLLRAVFANLRAGRYVQGGSTITQQLAKNIFLKPERTINRKIQELILSFWLEVRLSKSQILEIYLNRVYFGAGSYGIEAASRRYFGKAASQLSLGESAVLAGLLKAPSRYSPTRDPKRTLSRARVVLQNMVVTRAITQEDADAVIARPLHFVASQPPRRAKNADYAIDWIFERLTVLIGEPNGNIVVETTIDPGLQRYAQSAVQRHLDQAVQARNARQAAVVLLDNASAVKALVGGRAYHQSQFNRAVKAKRQPGSAFKPFIYLAALDNGFTPETVAYDEPITIGDWTPKNYSTTYRGAVTLRDALAQSINTVAVRLLYEVGHADVAATARRLGIKSKLADLPSLALGTSEVTPLELTAAYVPLSNGGRAMAPYIITRIRTHDGRTVYERAEENPPLVLTQNQVSAMNDMMAATMTYGTGTQAAFPPHPSAGKTGTTQDFRDAWFVGYTAHFTAGVWIGNDEALSMEKIVGGGLPARIWRDVMVRAHDGAQPTPLPGSYADRIRRYGTMASYGGGEKSAMDQSFLARVLGLKAEPEPAKRAVRRRTVERRKPAQWAEKLFQRE